MRKIEKRRRRENKTDYKLRMNLLKSKNPRIAIRKTNKYIIIQLIKSEEAQDKIVLGFTSKDLLNNGWDKKFTGSLKSIPAAYLTGLLMAKKLIGKKEGKGEVILDIGMARHLFGSRIYAAVKGLVDGGINIKADKKIFPIEKRLNGEHLKKGLAPLISKIKESIK